MRDPRVIYLDDDLLVVDKPAGLPTTAPSRDAPCLVRWIGQSLPDLRVHPTSRLDSPVSGLVTFTLNKAANQRLHGARRSGVYERVYLGITLHAPVPDAGRWQWPISIHRESSKLRTAGPGPAERPAVTHYEVATHAPHGSLLRLSPQTGRTHQLRVHAAKSGAPLFGDYAYGGERRLSLPDGTVVTARRVMLHCTRVAFPWLGQWRRFESPAPPDLRRAWRALGGDDTALGAP